MRGTTSVYHTLTDMTLGSQITSGAVTCAYGNTYCYFSIAAQGCISTVPHGFLHLTKPLFASDISILLPVSAIESIIHTRQMIVKYLFLTHLHPQAIVLRHHDGPV